MPGGGGAGPGRWGQALTDYYFRRPSFCPGDGRLQTTTFGAATLAHLVLGLALWRPMHWQEPTSSAALIKAYKALRIKALRLIKAYKALRHYYRKYEGNTKDIQKKYEGNTKET